MRAVAVCIAGLLRSLVEVGPSIQTCLVEPLDAELFIFGPIDGIGEWAPALSFFPTLQEVRFERENVTEVLHNAPGDGAGWRSATAVRGNWLGCLEGEATDMHRRGSGLCMMYSHKQCLDMIVGREAKRGRSFEHVVYSRADLQWIAAHPPLSLLPDGESDFWVPDGEDYGGVNDRHWVMPRWLASEMLTSWDRLVDGSAAFMFLPQEFPKLSTEEHFSYFLAYKGYMRLLRRMPSLAFVLCSNPHQRKSIDTSATSWDDSGRLDEVRLRCERGGPKYKHEYGHAAAVAECKGAAPWSLELLWECWCIAKEEQDVLHYAEYRICMHAKYRVMGYQGTLRIFDEEER